MIDLNTLISNALIAAVQQAIAPLNEQIAKLEEKVHFLEDQAIVTDNRTHARISALENNPAQGVDTQATPATITADAFVTHLDNQEWFWEKLQNRIDAATESALDNHCATYDHDDYDRAVSAFDDMPALDDFVTRDSVREEIEDVLNNATLSLSI